MIGTNTYQTAPSGTAWTYGNSNTYFCNGNSPFHDAAQSGSQYAVIQSRDTSGESIGMLTGTLTGLTQGATYSLAFYLGSRSGYPINPINVFVDGASVASSVAPADTRSGTDWTPFAVSFVALTTSPTLSFVGSSSIVDPSRGDIDTAIDDISVTPQAVPEPAPLGILGLGALGLLRRRRK